MLVLRWALRAITAMEPETLKNLNSATTRHVYWLVRVKSPKVVQYQFTARNETVHASRFECLLVSNDPKQFIIGSVSFSFGAKDAALKAQATYLEDLVFEIRNPQFDTKMKPDFISCPIKRVVSLAKPTAVKPIPPTDKDRQALPAKHIEVSMTIRDVMNALAGLKNAPLRF